ncbi:MAG: hypothetical protein ACE5I3_09570 [Phycisphaerae bacterium]
MSLNPLFWLHLRIGGSTRTNVIIVVAFAAVVIGFASFSFYMAGPKNYPQVNATWLAIMTVAQAVFLLLLAPSAVRRAVQRDFDSGMIESHRLSPMSNLKIILGYMTGAPIQAALLYIVSLVLGSYFAAQYALSPGLGGAIGLRATLSGWYFAQGCMLVLAAMIGAFVLLTALATRGKANVIGLAVLIGIFGGWVAIAFIPGLALLAGVLSGGVLFGLLTSAKIGGDPFVIVTAAVLQVLFCLILLAAACGKLRAPDRPLFSLRLGLILLLVWGFTLVAGMYAAPKYDWLFSEWRDHGHAQLVSSTVAFMLIALFPLIAGAVGLFYRDRSAAFGEQKDKRRRSALSLVPPMLALLTVLCLFLMFRGVSPQQLSSTSLRAFESRSAWIAIGAAMLFSFWIDFNWVYFLAARGKRIVIGLLIMLALLKGVPLGLDGVISFFARELAGLDWVGYGYLSGLSPIGTLMLAPKGGTPMWAGLIFQALLGVGATLLGRRVRRRLGREATGAPASEHAAALQGQT